MPALSDFLRDPPAFLRNNIVTYVGERPSQAGGGVFDFVLVPVRDAHARTRGGVFLGMSIRKADAGVYEIRWADAQLIGADRLARGERFRAIWSGYVPRGKSQAALPADGDVEIMLTPKMDGCSAAYSAQADGTARFSHYNLMDAKGTRTLPASRMIAEARADYAGVGNLGVMTKEHYNGKSNAGLAARFERKAKHADPYVNVFGWRRNGLWTFWIQYTDWKGAAQQILDVKQLTPGVKLG